MRHIANVILLFLLAGCELETGTVLVERMVPEETFLQLSAGKTGQQVRSLIGEPKTIRAKGSLETWEYPVWRGPDVSFIQALTGEPIRDAHVCVGSVVLRDGEVITATVTTCTKVSS